MVEIKESVPTILLVLLGCAVQGVYSVCTEVCTEYIPKYPHADSCSYDKNSVLNYPFLISTYALGENSKNCGECYRLTTNLGSMVFMVADTTSAHSPYCISSEDVRVTTHNMSSTIEEFFKQMMTNTMLVTKAKVSCSHSSNIGVIVETMSESALKVLIFNHNVGIERVQVQGFNQSYIDMARQIDNYWIADTTSLAIPYTLLVISTTNETLPLTLTNVQVDFSCTINPYRGNFSICFKAAPFYGMRLRREQEFMWKGVFAAISFWARVDSTQPYIISLRFGNYSIAEGPSLEIPLSADWQFYEVPLDYFKGPDTIGGDNLLDFLTYFYKDENPLVLLDDIKFVPVETYGQNNSTKNNTSVINGDKGDGGVVAGSLKEAPHALAYLWIFFLVLVVAHYF